MGALNPQRTSVALYSNIGEWVSGYAPGDVGAEHVPRVRGRRAGRLAQRPPRAQTAKGLDPDDYEAGFAVWSGTILRGTPMSLAGSRWRWWIRSQMRSFGAEDCARALNRARDEVLDELSLQVLDAG